jgi:hypothetical protein
VKVVKGVTRRITQAEYDKKRAKWRQQQKLHERKLARLSEVDEQYYVTVAYLLEIAARGSELFKAAEPNEKRELIGLLGQNLLLDGKNVQITLYKPFDTLASCLDSSIWLTTIEKVITVIKADLTKAQA